VVVIVGLGVDGDGDDTVDATTPPSA